MIFFISGKKRTATTLA